MVLLGIFGVIAYHFFYFSSLKYTSVSNTGIIHGFSPIVTCFLAALFINERLSKKNYFGIVLAIIGVLVLITRGKIQAIFGLDFNDGDILMLGAVLSWAIYSVLIKSLSKKYSSFTLTFYATASGVVLLFFLAMVEGGVAQVQSISSKTIVSLVYMGIFSSGLGYLLYNYAVKDLGPTKTASVVYSEVPIFVAILSFLFFKEAITFPMILSMVLVIIGLHAALSKGKEKNTLVSA